MSQSVSWRSIQLGARTIDSNYRSANIKQIMEESFNFITLKLSEMIYLSS